MKEQITKTQHMTRVTYRYVILSSGKTGEHTTLLKGWIKNITFITNQVQDEHIRVFSIDTIEHVSVQYKLPLEQFLKLASTDESSVHVIHKIK